LKPDNEYQTLELDISQYQLLGKDYWGTTGDAQHHPEHRVITHCYISKSTLVTHRMVAGKERTYISDQTKGQQETSRKQNDI